eukprot:Opistho-1_new@64817
MRHRDQSGRKHRRRPARRGDDRHRASARRAVGPEGGGMIVQDKVVTAWLATAKQGETMVYARATFLPVGSLVAKRARALAETGHVVLCQERRQHGAGDENFRFIMRRTGKPLPVSDGSLTVGGIRPA